MKRTKKMAMPEEHVHGLHCMMCCCTGSNGITHILAGAGLALLVSNYFVIPSEVFWGWILVGMAVIGHVWMMKRWEI